MQCTISLYTIYTAPDEVDDPVVVDGDILLSKEQAAIYKESGWDGLVKLQYGLHVQEDGDKSFLITSTLI